MTDKFKFRAQKKNCILPPQKKMPFAHNQYVDGIVRVLSSLLIHSHASQQFHAFAPPPLPENAKSPRPAGVQGQTREA